MKTVLKVIGVIVLLLVLGVAGFHVFRTDHRMTQAEAEEYLFGPNSRYIDWRDIKLHVIEEGAGPTVFIVHGLGGNCRSFDDMAATLSPHFRVVRFDLPGFGLSGIPEFDEPEPDLIQMHRDMIRFMIDRFGGGDSVAFIGNSLGGWISWETAAMAPHQVNKLVLLGPAGYEMEQIAAEVTGWLKNPVVRFTIAKGLSFEMAMGNLNYSAHRDDLLDTVAYWNKYAASNKEGNLDWMVRLATYDKFADTTLIPKVQAPTLIIWGTEDAVIPYRHAAKFKRDISNARLITYEDCGHVPMLEYPERTANDVLQFLRGE